MYIFRLDYLGGILETPVDVHASFMLALIEYGLKCREYSYDCSPLVRFNQTRIHVLSETLGRTFP